MGDEENIGPVKDDDGVMSLGGGRTYIYMGNEDGIDPVKKVGEGIKLGGVVDVSIAASHAWYGMHEGLLD